MENAKIYIEGMESQTEVQLIQQKINALPGISNLNIDESTQQLSLSYDPSTINLQDIIRSISETGMKAQVIRSKSKLSTWWREKQQLALIACGLTTLTTFLLGLTKIPQNYTFIGYIIAVLVGVYYPAKKAIIALMNLTATIHLLMLIGSVGALVLGMWSEAAILIFVYSLGDVLESYAVDKARGAIRSLMNLAPKQALVRKDGKEFMQAVEDINIGDLVIVKPGERIPVDGTVQTGSSFVDQSAVTGESFPITKSIGDVVFAGSINQKSFLEVKVDKPASETMLSKIIYSVEEAQAKKISFQRFSDKFSNTYTPAMFVLGILVAVIPPALFGADWMTFILRGLVVFVVSCSCGLALSVPVAVVAAMANGARKGVVFKGGAYFEAAKKVKVIAFDKTGTLTIGRPEVTDVISFGNPSQQQLLMLSSSMECRSNHPLANAVVRKAKESKISAEASLEEFTDVTGKGVKAKIEGQPCVAGNPRFMEENGISIQEHQDEIARLEDQGKTVILVGRNGKLLGILAIADALRPGAKETLSVIRKQGIRTVMLTGDNERCAKAIAAQAGVDEYYAQLLPEDKVRVIKELKEKYGSVAMVGDGVNDAPAMAASNVGIAMGAAGTDVAIEAGDIVLMSDDLSKINYVRELSAKTVNNIKQNIAVSLINIAFMVAAALLGYLGLVSGLLLNEISALVVIGNALRLLTTKNKFDLQKKAVT
ncbi:MAG: cation-translocating P-type ATPase [Candidatus Bathyarchaeota archaeon]|nr:cation-translocating P-type ATPase [Candidatus Bathyarchaeota archaeon]